MRALRSILLYAALGAVVTGAVAAIGAVWLPLGGRQVSFGADSPQAQEVARRLGPLPAGWGPPQRAARTRSIALTRWSVSGPLRGEASGEYLATLIRAGWPARCMEAASLWDSDAGTRARSIWRAGVTVPSGLRPWKHDPRNYNSTLPVRPLGAGWAINTLAFGAGLWAALRGWRVGRGLWRRWRGRCPGCGYPIAGGICPECGAGARKRAPPRRGSVTASGAASGCGRPTSCPS